MEKEFRRARLYDYIERFTIARGYPPSLAEMAAEIGYSDTIVRQDLAVMKERGCIDWFAGKARSIRITGPYRLPAKA
jgi:SOS-response transcriptional repressor LexA